MNSAEEYRWENLPDAECPICKGDIRIFTCVPGGEDGDDVQCEACNHNGVIYRDGKSQTINWNPYEPE